jgi:hypothetical protein
MVARRSKLQLYSDRADMHTLMKLSHNLSRIPQVLLREVQPFMTRPQLMHILCRHTRSSCAIQGKELQSSEMVASMFTSLFIWITIASTLDWKHITVLSLVCNATYVMKTDIHTYICPPEITQQVDAMLFRGLPVTITSYRDHYPGHPVAAHVSARAACPSSLPLNADSECHREYGWKEAQRHPRVADQTASCSFAAPIQLPFMVQTLTSKLKPQILAIMT